MTSGNVSDEPIAYRDDDALERLAAIADLFLVHDRPIDDAHRRLGRARGAAAAADAAALARLRARGARAAGRRRAPRARVRRRAEEHVLRRARASARGSATTSATSRTTRRCARSARASRTSSGCSRSRPQVVAHDLHPDYLSTRYALDARGRRARRRPAPPRAPGGVPGRARRDRAGGRRDLRRHRATGPTARSGAASCCVGDLRGFERAGHLRPVRLPGGDRAVREPWRMACAWLREARRGAPRCRGARRRVEPDRWDAVARLARDRRRRRRSRPAPGGCSTRRRALRRARDVTYEGQAAIELEAACDPAERGAYPLPVERRRARRAAGRARRRGRRRRAACGPASCPRASTTRSPTPTAAACVARGGRARPRHGRARPAASFQNRLLLERDRRRACARRGLRVLVPERLPPNDGGIAYGQAAVAAARDSTR